MTQVTRRRFLRTSGQALIGTVGVLGRAPASWAARELSLLTAVNYAPASDAKLDELAKRFTKATGVERHASTTIQSVQMPAKLSAELMARSGHDIVEPRDALPWLFQPGLVDVSDICADLARKHGEWFPFLKEHAQRQGAVARRALSVQLVPGQPPHRPVREGGRAGARHLGRPAPGRPQAEEARPPGRASPSARRPTRSPRCTRSCGASAPRTSPRTARRSPSTRRRPRRRSSTSARSTPTRWTRPCCPGTTPATTSG